jgi:predicted transcriptional regulator
MDRYRWQRRAREAGLSQTRLARLLGVSDNAISDGLRGKYGEEPDYITTMIIAWEIMTPAQREELEAKVLAERQAKAKD